MARNEDVTTAIWTDPDFSDLSFEAKGVYVWSFTNEHNNMAGLYKIGRRTMSFELNLEVERIDAALAELTEAGFLSLVDSVMFVRARVKRLRTKSPQIARSIAKAVEQLAPEHPQRLAFMRAYGMEEWLVEHLAVLMPVDGWEKSSWVSDRTRAAVFERDGYRCVDCGAQDHLQIDHVHPRSAGGDGTMANLATRCRSCNASKGVALPQKPVKSEPLRSLNKEAPTSGSGQGKGLRTGPPQTFKENDSLPRDFPRELLPHLRSSFRVLRDLAVRNHAKAVNPLSLASVVMARPHKPLVRSAYDCAAHWDARGQQVKDVVAAYRNWLDKADDLAGYEQLGPDGLPAGGGRLSPVKETASSMLRDMWPDEAANPVFVDAEVISEDAA